MSKKYPSFEALRPHFEALAICGYYKNVMKRLSFGKLVLFQIYRVFITSLAVLYNFQHYIKLYQVRHSTPAVVDILFVLLTTTNTMVKQCAFNFRSQRVDRLIETVNGDLFTASNPTQDDMIQQNVKSMSRLLSLYHGAIYTCVIMWAVFPEVNRYLGKEVGFSAYFPFDTAESPNFEIALSYMILGIAIQAYANCTMDCTIVALYAQGYTQLRILGHNLQILSSKTMDDGRMTEYVEKLTRDERNDRDLQRRFIRCVEHYKLVVWFVKEVDDIFNESMVLQFLVMAFVICMTLFKLVGLDLMSVEFVSMAMYLMCMLAQLFIYCYYGTKVEKQSEDVSLSLYSTDWLQFTPKFRRQMLVFMLRASRSISPTAAYVIPLSLETYISILRLSYTLFAVLEKSRDK